MKKTILTLFIGLLSVYVYGQSNDGSEKKQFKKDRKEAGKCSSFYIALSGGVNNNTGIVGVSLDWPVAPHVSVEGGVGLSTWGEKLYVGGKYFLRPCHLGWAFGAGITYNTGLKDFQDNLETIDGDTEPVELQLNPQANILIAAYKYWQLGRGGSRFYIEFGYSQRLVSGDNFTQTGGTPISPNAVNAVNFTSPGGLIAAIGFSFGVR